ncbi:hypothetical protein ACWKYD_06420 [Enterobacter cloacae]
MYYLNAFKLIPEYSTPCMSDRSCYQVRFSGTKYLWNLEYYERERDMNAIFGSYHSAVPAWVTIFEAANVINQQSGVSVTKNDVWRYALYGHLSLSVYF